MKVKNVIGFTCASFLLLGSISLGVVAANKEKVYTPTFATYTNHDASTYYNSIDFTANGETLLAQLQNLNKTKRKSTVGYNSMGTSPSGQFKYTDYDPNFVQYDSNGQPYGTKISSFYTYTSATSWNREHVWPNTHGGGTGSGLSNTVDADIHMPRPTIAAENSSRGHSYYVEGMNSSSNGWDPKTAGYDEKSRGEAARIILYCVVADSRLELEAANSSGTKNNKMGNIETLLKWNMEYDVTDREKNRNEGAEYLQGNRNPFIDHREWGCRIWGKTNNKTKEICAGYLDDGPKVDVTGITLNTNSAEVSVGKTVTLTPTIAPANATIPTVNWTSSNTAIATVEGGVVKGISQGTATITATTVDGNFTATCQITVTAAVTVNVTFNTDGGSSISTQAVIAGHTVSKPVAPTKTGYVFSEWRLQGESSAYDFTANVNENITLVAQWVASSSSTHGLYEGDPLTPAEAIAMCDQAGSDKIVGTNKQYYVKGVFDKGTSVDTTYHQWEGTLNGTGFKVYSAINVSGTEVSETSGAMDNREIIVKGFLELYKGTYQVSYLPPSSSPTGAKFVPSIVYVQSDSNTSGGTQGGGSGNEGGNTGGESGNTGNTGTGGDSGNTGNTGNEGGNSGNTGNTGNEGGNNNQGGGNTQPVDLVNLKSTLKLTAPTKQEYKVGEKLDLAGFKAEAVYDNGTKDVTASVILYNNNKQIQDKDNFVLNSAGDVFIKVVFTEGDQFANATFMVTVTGSSTSEGLGCGGSIIASSAIISLTSLMGLSLLLYKKNKQK